MKRFFNFLLVLGLLFSPALRSCPTCYGKELAAQGYSKKQINSETLHNTVLHEMKHEEPQEKQPTVITQRSKFISQNKQSPSSHKNKIGSSRRMIEYTTNAGSQ
jgi:hypothetical protein